MGKKREAGKGGSGKKRKWEKGEVGKRGSGKRGKWEIKKLTSLKYESNHNQHNVKNNH